jgi:serine protease AprX
MRQEGGWAPNGTRTNALWGSKKGMRGNALWGRGGRRSAILIALCLMLTSAVASGSAAPGESSSAFVPQSLRDAATANPDAVFKVIVQGGKEKSTTNVATDVQDAQTEAPGKAPGLKRRFLSLAGVSAELTGRQILRLSTKSGIFAITDDAGTRPSGYSNTQAWPSTAGALWGPPPKSASYPTIAVVDSGIDTLNSAFGSPSRVLAQVNLTSLGPNSPGDGRGHGTFVAGIASNGNSDRTGIEPRAKLVSLDVLNDSGAGLTSDVIAACDWILQNKATYNIRVANFSLNGGSATSFQYDPLDKAVEKLWLNGVVVVAAAGNYAVDGQQSGVRYAPANDPFVITVGASDTNDSSSPSDDFAAPWSANGYTPDGFLKPELSAPGRVLNGPVPSTATMFLEHPERLVSPGYMWMSGTSFAAPVVSGAAATVLSRHPNWTPDQVKGALMVGASVPSGYGSNGALGVGIVSASAAASADGTANPNAGLNQFLTTDTSTGLKTFDAASWANAARANASWNSASWSTASWAAASWSTASWSSASWSTASWATASWSTASWATASWADNAQASSIWVK